MILAVKLVLLNKVKILIFKIKLVRKNKFMTKSKTTQTISFQSIMNNIFLKKITMRLILTQNNLKIKNIKNI